MNIIYRKKKTKERKWNIYWSYGYHTKKTNSIMKSTVRINWPRALILPTWCSALARADLPTLGIPTSIRIIVSPEWPVFRSSPALACRKLRNCKMLKLVMNPIYIKKIEDYQQKILPPKHKGNNKLSVTNLEMNDIVFNGNEQELCQTWDHME